MTEAEKTAHIEVDEKLQGVEDRVDAADGAGSPAIKPLKDLGENGKPTSATQPNRRT